MATKLLHPDHTTIASVGDHPRLGLQSPKSCPVVTVGWSRSNLITVCIEARCPLIGARMMGQTLSSYEAIPALRLLLKFVVDRAAQDHLTGASRWKALAVNVSSQWIAQLVL